jgi:hypothetical protein
VSYHGVLAPNAKWRSHIVPAEPVPDGTSAADSVDEEKKTAHYIHWARLLKRVFGIDLESCPNCGGPLKIIAAIEQPNAIHKILTHLGLQAHPPPRAPARYDPEREADLIPSPAMTHSSVH